MLRRRRNGEEWGSKGKAITGPHEKMLQNVLRSSKLERFTSRNKAHKAHIECATFLFHCCSKTACQFAVQRERHFENGTSFNILTIYVLTMCTFQYAPFSLLMMRLAGRPNIQSLDSKQFKDQNDVCKLGVWKQCSNHDPNCSKFCSKLVLFKIGAQQFEVSLYYNGGTAQLEGGLSKCNWTKIA